MLKSAFLSVCFLLLSATAFAQSPVPFVNAPLVPATAAPGGAAFTLTVNGNGFVSGATVDWNGAPLQTTFVSASQLTAQVPAANIASTSTASVTVVNPQNAIPSSAVFFTIASKSPTVTFANAANTPVSLAGNNFDPVEPLSTVAGDFNGDGILDLVVATVYSPAPGYTVAVYFGAGNGSFTAGPSTAVSGTAPDFLTAADLNGDGKLDLIVGDFTGNSIEVLLGKGDGSFTVTPESPIAVGNLPNAAVLGDFNHDGKLDLAIPIQNDKTIAILLGNGDGSFTPAPGSPIQTGLGVASIAVGDFNGDGKLDLAASNLDYGSTGQSITVLLGNGDGTFTQAASPAAPYSASLVAADFNGDGKLDLAVSDYYGNGVMILTGNGDGTFSQGSSCCGTILPRELVIGMNVADFNGDGKLDLVLSMWNTANNSSYETTLLGNGDGTFTPTNFSIAVSSIQAPPTLGDFNGDGKIDIATVSTPYSYLDVLLQQPAGGPAPTFSLVPYTPSATVVAGDTATYVVAVNSVNGFVGGVTVSCSGLPSTTACQLPPATTYIADGMSSGFQVSITTTPRPMASGVATPGTWSGGGRGLFGLVGALVALIALFFAAAFSVAGKSAARMPVRIGMRSIAFAPLALLLASLVFVSSCGSGSKGPVANPGTPAGTYTVTLTGTSGTLTNSTTVTLVVQ